MDEKTKRTAELGGLLAAAVMLGYVEAVLPISTGIPGIKAGLANCAVLFVLYRYDGRRAAMISLLRTVILAFLFTNLSMLLYSLTGALCSIVVMCALKRTARFSIFGVSMAGGVIHNLAQLAVALGVTGIGAAVGREAMLYPAVLMIWGLFAGVFNALLAGILLKRIPQGIRQDLSR